MKEKSAEDGEEKRGVKLGVEKVKGEGKRGEKGGGEGMRAEKAGRGWMRGDERMLKERG